MFKNIPPGAHAERELRVLLQIEDRHILAGEDQGDRPIGMFNGDPPGCSSFVGVGRADDQHVRDRTQPQQLFNRLMGGAVFSQGDAVMGKDIDHVQPHQSSQTDRGAHVIGEDQEGGSEGHDASMSSHAVQDRPHAVFPHAKMEVVAGILPAASRSPLGVVDRLQGTFEVTSPGQGGVRGGIQVRRTADEGG